MSHTFRSFDLSFWKNLVNRTQRFDGRAHRLAGRLAWCAERCTDVSIASSFLVRLPRLASTARVGLRRFVLQVGDGSQRQDGAFLE
jgi:hypothetical protein